MLNNKPLLIGIVLLLAALRFLIVPWMDYQDEQRQQLETLTKRLVRSEALLEFKEQLYQQKDKQDIVVAKFTGKLEQSASVQQYQLELQQRLQQLIENKNAKLELFDWLSDSDLKALNMHRARINLRFTGQLSDVIGIHLMIEQQFPFAQILDLNTSWIGNLGKGRNVTVTMLIEADYRVTAP